MTGTFGAQLRSWLQHSGVKQYQLAQTLNVHPSLVSHWKSGRAMPDERQAHALDAAVGAAGTLATALDAQPAAPAAAATSMPPMQLPRGVARLIGRERERRELLHLGARSGV